MNERRAMWAMVLVGLALFVLNIYWLRNLQDSAVTQAAYDIDACVTGEGGYWLRTQYRLDTTEYRIEVAEDGSPRIVRLED